MDITWWISLTNSTTMMCLWFVCSISTMLIHLSLPLWLTNYAWCSCCHVITLICCYEGFKNHNASPITYQILRYLIYNVHGPHATCVGQKSQYLWYNRVSAHICCVGLYSTLLMSGLGHIRKIISYKLRNGYCIHQDMFIYFLEMWSKLHQLFQKARQVFASYHNNHFNNIRDKMSDISNSILHTIRRYLFRDLKPWLLLFKLLFNFLTFESHSIKENSDAWTSRLKSIKQACPFS